MPGGKEDSSRDSVAESESGSVHLMRVAGIVRNRWPLCVGIGGRIASEYAVVSIPERKLVKIVRPAEGNDKSDFHGIGVRILAD